MSTQGIVAGGCYRPDASSNWKRKDAPKGEGCYAMPGGANVTLQDGKVNVNGGRGADDIDVQKLKNGNYSVTVNGKSIELDGAQVKQLDIKAGRGDDRVHVGQGVDVKTTIDGGSGSDAIVNHANDAFIKGGSGHDQIFNSGRGARIDGGRGNDALFNTGARAQINGGAGHDSIANTGAFARVDGGRGNDQVFNAGFAALLKGGLGHDSLYNRGAFSKVDGGSGHDTLVNEGFGSRVNGGRGLDHTLDLQGAGREALFGGGRAHQRFDLASFLQQSLLFRLF